MILVKIRLPVLDLELTQVLFINPDLTLTFDPATLTFVKIQALINANLMCKIYQNSSLLMATTDLQTPNLVAY